MEVSLSRPDITQREIEAVLEVLRSPLLSIGPKVKEFEEVMADYIGVGHAVAVNSGTSGLHLLIRALGIGQGDEVLTTPFSFVASSNCILFEGAIPVFADIEEDSLNIDPNWIKSKITGKTRGILPVHVFGKPADMAAIMEIAKERDLAVIEDACEALGAECQGRKAGSFGDGAVFAFYPNKQITTGEGGMIITDNPVVARRCRSMRNQGRADNSTWLEHEQLGYNYRLDEMSAALGVVQMKRLEEIQAKRSWVAQKYNEKLKNIAGVRIPPGEITGKESWFVYVIRLNDHLDRDQIMDHLNLSGVQCRPYFSPIHLQRFYQEKFGYRGGEFPVAERVSRQTLALPFYNNLTEEEIDYVVMVLKEAINRFG